MKPDWPVIGAVVVGVMMLAVVGFVVAVAVRASRTQATRPPPIPSDALRAEVIVYRLDVSIGNLVVFMVKAAIAALPAAAIIGVIYLFAASLIAAIVRGH